MLARSSAVEVWMPVHGFEGSYEVSSFGHVRSLDRVQVYSRTVPHSGAVVLVRRMHRGRMLRPGQMSSGHLSVSLGREHGSRCVHTLVLEAFVGPRPDGMDSLHRDGVPTNNWIGNLHWGTRSENLLDAVKHGQKKVGENVWSAKLTAPDVAKIRQMIGSVSTQSIATMYGVNESQIRAIKNGKTWKHVPLPC